MSDLQDVRNKIHQACERSARATPPQLIAVSKMQSLEKMMLVYEEGQRFFGENYVQELVSKKAQLEALGVLDLDLHFIGHLQTNKVKQLLPHISTIHSVDSIKLLEEISNRARTLDKKIHCYFEVNIDDEASKGGFRIADLPALAEKITDFSAGVIPMGLMCIPDPKLNLKASFEALRKFSEKYTAQLGAGLSMGMSQDFELAIECGSTAVRVGSAIFGARSKPISS